jgi:hypothetical protein
MFGAAATYSIERDAQVESAIRGNTRLTASNRLHCQLSFRLERLKMAPVSRRG